MPQLDFGNRGFSTMFDDDAVELTDAGLEAQELDDEVHGFDDQPGDDPHFAHRLDAGFELIETLHH